MEGLFRCVALCCVVLRCRSSVQRGDFYGALVAAQGQAKGAWVTAKGVAGVCVGPHNNTLWERPSKSSMSIYRLLCHSVCARRGGGGAEETRAPNWEVHTQRSNWAQGRPTHGSEMSPHRTSPNRTHSNAQGDREVRAQQQPPSAAHAEQAISKHLPPSLYKVPTYSTRVGAAPRTPGGARHGGGNRAVTSQPRAGQSTSYGDVKSSYGGPGRWGRSGCTKGAPWSANRQEEEQHRHTGRGSRTRRDECEHSRQGGGAQQGRRGNQDREPERRGWESVRMGGSDNKGDGPASQPCHYRVPGQPLLNRHQVGGVSRSPDGLFAQQEWEPIRGRPAVRGKGTYGGRSGQRVEEQGTWASRTQKHS